MNLSYLANTLSRHLPGSMKSIRSFFRTQHFGSTHATCLWLSDHKRKTASTLYSVCARGSRRIRNLFTRLSNGPLFYCRYDKTLEPSLCHRWSVHVHTFNAVWGKSWGEENAHVYNLPKTFFWPNVLFLDFRLHTYNSLSFGDYQTWSDMSTSLTLTLDREFIDKSI